MSSHGNQFAHGGKMAARMAKMNWESTPVGPPESWPQSLQVAVRIILTSRYAMWMAWGPELTFFCNDAYLPTLGVKEAWALGASARKVWEEIWPDIGPRIDRVLNTGEATWDEGLRLFLERSGYTEETYHTFSYSPLFDDSGAARGMLCVVTEETERVIGERRLSALRDFAAELSGSKTESEVYAATARCLTKAQRDFPFALIYAVEEDAGVARLVSSSGTIGTDEVASFAPETIALEELNAAWPLKRIYETGQPIEMDDLPSRFPNLPQGPWPKSPQRAIILPLAHAGHSRPAGMFVAGMNPFRQYDEGYRSFAELFVGQLNAGVNNAQAYDAERRRAEALAEIDRAKTTFFSNISHEFRTPLTLMLGPLADIIGQRDDSVSDKVCEELSVVHRNGLRLLKLVNTLLDFARIEAGRVRAAFVETNLSSYTADLASVFRSAVEKAGLTYSIDMPSNVNACIDRDMWEKIVLNLISNAFKFTLNGGITVKLRAGGGQIQLTVTDTGCGIPPQELPRLFERFYRIEGAKGRTHEGSGIGLAFVHELVKIHGGHVSVKSELGKGSTFAVTIPEGNAHLPSDKIVETSAPEPAGVHSNAFLEEAMRWLPEESNSERSSDVTDVQVDTRVPAPPNVEGATKLTVLIADDNADMRGYLRRLLSECFNVIAVSDGQEALAACRESVPCAIVSDVMMPNLDGFGLMRAVRADPSLAGVPFILVSAKAGEEARLEGIRSGADDYIVKPFSAREFVVRVEAQIQRKQFERQLAFTEERLQSALAAARMAAWEWDPQEDQVKVSATATQVFGLKSEQTLDNSRIGLSLIHPGDRESHRAKLYNSVNSGEGFETIYRIIRPIDGQTAWLEERSRIIKDPSTGKIRLIGLVMDITARIVAEAALKQSEERLKFAIESGDLGTFYCPVPLKTILGNDKFKELNWLPRDADVDFERFFSILHQDDRERLRNAVEQSVFYRQPFDIEYRTVAPDGRERWIRAKGRAYYGAQGTPNRFDGITLDVTDLKNTEKRREEALEAERAARQQAEHVSRIKDEFLATLSHELRTPLNAIVGWSSILKKNNSNPKDIKSGIDVIERNARAQSQMIEDLLDMSRIISGKIRLDVQHVLIADIVASAIKAVQPSAEMKGIRLITILDSHAGPVAGDTNRLQQIVWNLLTNAIKFTSRGGKVQVVLERVNSHLELSVSDTGEGISPEFLPFVFERFRQADASTTRKHGGLGLGLSIVKQLIELHGGSIRAKSPGLGQGSTFILNLPLAVAHLGGPAGSSREHPRASGNAQFPDPPTLNGVRILVVDDDVDGRQLLKRILEDGGASVVTASSVREALSVLDEMQFNVLVSDIGMPEEDGYDLIRKVRSRSSDQNGTVPAIALTAFARSEDRQRAIRSGFQIHVAKPVEPSEIVTVCASLAGRKFEESGCGSNTTTNSNACKFLVVDDHQDAAETLAMMLRLEGQHTDVAFSAMDALKRLNEVTPAAILIDLSMPDMDGYELARKIRQLPNASGSILVALTGWDESETRQRTAQAGFDYHFVKPIEESSFKELLNAVRHSDVN